MVSATASLNECAGEIVPEGICECASSYVQSISACFPMTFMTALQDEEKDRPSKRIPRSVELRGNGLPRILLRAVGILAALLCIITIAQVVLNEFMILKDYRENIVVY